MLNNQLIFISTLRKGRTSPLPWLYPLLFAVWCFITKIVSSSFSLSRYKRYSEYLRCSIQATFMRTVSGFDNMCHFCKNFPLQKWIPVSLEAVSNVMQTVSGFPQWHTSTGAIHSSMEVWETLVTGYINGNLEYLSLNLVTEHSKKSFVPKSVKGIFLLLL